MRTAYKCRAYPDLEQAGVLNLIRNRALAKAISDCGWGTFREMSEYKAARYGRRVIIVDRWYPSSKRCSACGADVSHSGSSRVRSAVKQEHRPVRAGIPVLQGGE